MTTPEVRSAMESLRGDVRHYEYGRVMASAGALQEVLAALDCEEHLKYIDKLEKQLASLHGDACENGHATHEECSGQCSCVGSGKSRVEIAEGRVETLEAELAEARTELARVDDALSRRDALEDIPDRVVKILLLIRLAKKLDPGGSVFASLRPAGEKGEGNG